MTLFKMWEDAYIEARLPKEWPIWENFRTWAIANRYKAEYGYKGEFSPQGCLKAMPDYTEPILVEKTTPKGGPQNASKKTNARSRSGNSV